MTRSGQMNGCADPTHTVNKTTSGVYSAKAKPSPDYKSNRCDDSKLTSGEIRPGIETGLRPITGAIADRFTPVML